MHKISRLGFTLIEILVTLLVIGIITTVLVISAGQYYVSSKRDEYFARELVDRINLARQQAIFSFTTLGLNITPSEYVFLQLNENKARMNWKPIEDSFWKPQPIPENLTINIQIQDNNSGEKKQIMLFPTGEVTPFILIIHRLKASKAYTIKGTKNGSVSIVETK